MTTNEPLPLIDATPKKPKGHALTPQFDEHDDAVFDGRFFWIGILPTLPGVGYLTVAGLAFPVAALYPFLYGHRQYCQGLFVRAGCTGLVARGAVLRVVVILAAAPLLLGPMGANGARLGVTLAVVGLFAEGIFLEIMSRARALPLLDRLRESAG